MAKQKTKKELEKEISLLTRVGVKQQEKIEALKTEVDDVYELRRKDLEIIHRSLKTPSMEKARLNTIPVFESGRILNGGAEIPEPRAVDLLVDILNEAGRLSFIDQEYAELKDRTLPVPKMQVKEMERIHIRGDERSGL